MVAENFEEDFYGLLNKLNIKKRLKDYIILFKSNFNYNDDELLRQFSKLVKKDVIKKEVPEDKLLLLIKIELDRCQIISKPVNTNEKDMRNYDNKGIDNKLIRMLVEIDSMDGKEFEMFMKRVLEKLGYKVEITKFSGDQGADLIAEYNNKKYAMQVKRYSITNRVSNKAVQEVVASKNMYKCEGAIVITNSFYTDSAIKLAKANNVELWDRGKLIELLRSI